MCIMIERIKHGQWKRLRDLRLRALSESPKAFMSTLESASQRSPESWAKQADASVSGSERITLLASQDGAMIGIAALYHMNNKPEDWGELLQVWVDPDFRRMSVAAQMIQKIHSWAYNNQYRVIIATVHIENPGAIRFYKKLGYETDSIETAQSPPRDHVLRYELKES